MPFPKPNWFIRWRCEKAGLSVSPSPLIIIVCSSQTFPKIEERTTFLKNFRNWLPGLSRYLPDLCLFFVDSGIDNLIVKRNLFSRTGKYECMGYQKALNKREIVIVYSSPDDKKKNRGFCFLENESHKAASLAKRRISSRRVKVWGCEIVVDWADPQEEPDQETMAKVKVLYVRNLTAGVTEEKLKELFKAHGRVERVKKIKDYAFVHFEERDNATKAMEALNNLDICGARMEISLAKPPSDKKKKEEVLRNRERRMMQLMKHRAAGSWYDAPLHLMHSSMIGTDAPPPPPPMRGASTGGRNGVMPPPPRLLHYDM